MRIYLATLATPTYTSELYEFSIRDLAEMYVTKAFGDRESAVEWAKGEVIRMETENADDDQEYETAHLISETSEQRAISVSAETENITWIVWSHDDNASPEESYAAKIWEQELE
jgi:hypothetical protein